MERCNSVDSAPERPHKLSSTHLVFPTILQRLGVALGTFASLRYINVVLHRILPRLLKKTFAVWSQRKRRKFIGFVVSLIHSLIASTFFWKLWSSGKWQKVVQKKGVEGILHQRFPLLQWLMSLSTGYFMYDILDMRSYGGLTNSLLTHHLVVLSGMGLCAASAKGEGFALLANAAETNSIFLHIRSIFLMLGLRETYPKLFAWGLWPLLLSTFLWSRGYLAIHVRFIFFQFRIYFSYEILYLMKNNFKYFFTIHGMLLSIKLSLSNSENSSQGKESRVKIKVEKSKRRLDFNKKLLWLNRKYIGYFGSLCAIFLISLNTVLLRLLIIKDKKILRQQLVMRPRKMI